MPSKPNILIVGPNGSGKSSSLESFFSHYASEIDLIDTERKSYPFRFNLASLGSYVECSTKDETSKAIQDAITSPRKYIVLDSLFQYSNQIQMFCTFTYTGYDIYKGHNTAHKKFFQTIKASGKIFIATAVDEVVSIETADGGKLNRIRASIPGKELEGKLEGEFLIVLVAGLMKNIKTGAIEHKFWTKTDGINSAKTPVWLGLDGVINNDLKLVIDKLNTE